MICWLSSLATGFSSSFSPSQLLEPFRLDRGSTRAWRRGCQFHENLLKDSVLKKHGYWNRTTWKTMRKTMFAWYSVTRSPLCHHYIMIIYILRDSVFERWQWNWTSYGVTKPGVSLISQDTPSPHGPHQSQESQKAQKFAYVEAPSIRRS